MHGRMTRFGRSYTRPGPPRCCERQERFKTWIKIMIRLLPALGRRRWLGERGLLQVERPTARNHHTSPEIRNLTRQAILITTQHGKHYTHTGTGETRAHRGTLLVLSAIAHTYTNTQASQNRSCAYSTHSPFIWGHCLFPLIHSS